MNNFDYNRKEAKKTNLDNDILLFLNHRNGRLEYREHVEALIRQIVYAAKRKHNLGGREMLAILREEFYHVIGEIIDEDMESEFCESTNGVENSKNGF